VPNFRIVEKNSIKVAGNNTKKFWDAEISFIALSALFAL
jgi:hypothetical protein